MTTARLIIFTRYPEPGQTKTRMIPVLGPEGAAQLQDKLTKYTLQVVSQLELEDLSVAIYYTGGNLTLMQQWLGNNWSYYSQSPGNLGQRLQSALEDSYREGYTQVAIIGTDCPDLTPVILRDAFKNLNQKDVVIGPAVDGGYYLIGLSCFIPEVFENIDWGTEKVLQQTQSIITRLNLGVSYLPKIRDLDRPEDLDMLKD